MIVTKHIALLGMFIFLMAVGVPAEEPSVIPVGLDAYRQWDHWAYQRIGARAYMRSTYDRSGGNEGADASHFLYQLADDYNVTLDVEGPGVLYFTRYNHWHGSPWHYVVDGQDTIVQESSTADPSKPAENSVFLPTNLFPSPLALTWAETRGADLSWVPISFEKTFRMAYSRTHYGTGYYIYQQYVRGARLSQQIKSWDGQTPPASDVLDLVANAGNDIAPEPGTAAGDKLGVIRQVGGPITLAKAATLPVLNLQDDKPNMIRAVEFSVPLAQAIDFGKARLRITWDNRPDASVDAPVALFFGAGTLYNRDAREYLVKAFPVTVRQDTTLVHLACYFPMPFFSSAKIELVGNGQSDISGISWNVRYQPFRDPQNQVGYFHATYHDFPMPVLGKDMVFLDTRTTEGGGDWTGTFVGTSFIFSDNAVLSTLEGDPRFFFDDSLTPQAQGTGTEEWGGGGDYWGGLNMTLPFAGHPVGAKNAATAKNADDKIESAYRFLLGDLMPFGKNAVIQFEHGGTNNSVEHYQSVTYWYGLPGASLVLTDRFQIGDKASEKAHAYYSLEASAPYSITSRYEWGPDTLPATNPDGPLAHPADMAEFEFQADAGTYNIWVRGKASGDTLTDASWLQFDEDINTTDTAPSYSTKYGFGNWRDQFPADVYAWSSELPKNPAKTVIFKSPGTHRLRLQTRQSPHDITHIWLSSTQSTVPAATQLPPAVTPGETLIDATNPVLVTGNIKVVSDPSTATGKMLHVDGQAAPSGPSEVVIYPPETDVGRSTTGTSEFTLKITPGNFGVLLRRKLDYAFPNQRAEVYVADDSATPDWKLAGTWFLAGSNTCVYSNPPGELGATVHRIETSDRRFRDDEFLVPRDLTEGRSSLRIRVKFTPVNTPLFPGYKLPALAWSEIRYDAYCFVMPPQPLR